MHFVFETFSVSVASFSLLSPMPECKICRLSGSPKFGGPFLGSQDIFLLSEEALKFGINAKICIEIINNLKYAEKTLEKYNFYLEIFIFRSRFGDNDFK